MWGHDDLDVARKRIAYSIKNLCKYAYFRYHFVVSDELRGSNNILVLRYGTSELFEFFYSLRYTSDIGSHFRAVLGALIIGIRLAP